MKKGKIHRLGDLQLRIMKVLWAREEATVADVFEELGKDADLAYTTVSTMLRKMEARGLITHRTEGRSFVYRPKVASEAVSRSMIDHLVDRMFEGNLTAAVNHLLTTREVSREELKALEHLIAERKKSK
jgi:BlaI family transcriptional regulator, penicillinase repressor